MKRSPRSSFQSTPSTRRETALCLAAGVIVFISIHSLHTEGDKFREKQKQEKLISIHSLHTEGDSRRHAVSSRLTYFNPLPPHGGRRDQQYQGCGGTAISIHSLHTEGDMSMLRCRLMHRISIHSLHTEGDSGQRYRLLHQIDFNPLPPHGGRHLCRYDAIQRKKFQSTPSTRRETSETTTLETTTEISIHSLHTEGDLSKG